MLFGIFALIAVGLSWTLVGIVMGMAPKKNVDPALIQLGGSMVTITVGTLIFYLTGGVGMKGDFTISGVWVCMAYFTSGLLNCIMLVLMSKAMQKGPNGMIWTIIQSAMIFPFLMGVLFFGVAPKIIRIFGLLMILTGLTLSGCAKDNSSSGGNWRLLAFIAFLITGVQQCLASIPSYFEAGRNLSPIIRSIATASGTLLTSGVLLLQSGKWKNWGGMIRSKWLWIFIGSLQFFGLIFAYLLLYPGMDAMAKNGIGSASYPLMIASCIIGFFLYCSFVIREKNSILQYGALAGCLLGIILICC